MSVARLFLLISAHEDNDNNTTHVQAGENVYASAAEAMAAADSVADENDDVQYIVHLQVGHCCWYVTRQRSLYYLDRDHSWQEWAKTYSYHLRDEPWCPILGPLETRDE